jgi:hypothetical protein
MKGQKSVYLSRSDAINRVTFLLPRNNREEERAVLAVIDYLKQQCLRRIPVLGFTYSVVEQPVFWGHWWDPLARGWAEPEQVVLFMIDYAGQLDDRMFRRSMARLRQIISGRYVTFGSPQKELWVIGQRGVRYA